MPSYFPRFFTSFDVEATGVFSKVEIYIGHKFKHDRTKQGSSLALFLKVLFLDNLVCSRAPKQNAKQRKNSYDSYDT